MTTATTSVQPAPPGPPALRRVPPLPGQLLSWPTRRPSPAVQDTLALDLSADLTGHDEPQLCAVPDDEGRMAADSAEQALHARAARFSMAVVEAVGGDRPVTQLLRWTTTSVYEEVAELVRRLGHGSDALERARTDRPRLVSVHVSSPDDDVAEVSGHVRQGRRSRALALRLEVHRDRWVCTALALG